MIESRNEYLNGIIKSTEEIRVYCDDLSTRDRPHHGRRARVATFLPLGDGPDRWVAIAGNRFVNDARSHKTEDISVPAIIHRVRADGSTVDPTTGGENYDHEKLVLRCELCGLDVQRRFTTDVRGILDRLQAEGVDELALTSLAAILR